MPKRKKPGPVPNKDYGPEKIVDTKKDMAKQKKGKFRIGDKKSGPPPPNWTVVE